MSETTYCECGRTYAMTSGMTVSRLRCDKCPAPKYPRKIRSFFNLIERVDEWMHVHGRPRSGRYSVPWWWRPVCDWRDRQYA